MSKLHMLRRVATAIASIGLISGCAHAPDPKPAVCDGHHRRPANPFGSVLPSFPNPSASPAPAASAPDAGHSAAPDPRSFHPCGRKP